MNTIYAIEETAKSAWLQKIPTTKDALFVLDWVVLDTHHYAVGLHPSTRSLMKFDATIQPSLFVWAQSIDIVQNLIAHAYDIMDSTRKISSHGHYFSNQATVIDELLSNTKSLQTWQLFQIPTKSFRAAKKLHTVFNYRQSTSLFVNTTSSWSIEIFIMLSLHLKYPNLKDLPIFSTILNPMLDYDTTIQFKPDLDVMVFDIETASHQDHRLPMGDNLTDVMTSVTIIKYSVTKEIYELSTIFNIPTTDIQELAKAKDIIHNHNKPYKHITQRFTTIVNSEIELIKQTLAHFLDDRFELFILLGFNSKYYDMSFLFRRTSYLNLSEINNFYYMHGITTYGHKMIHVDMQHIIKKYYRGELSSFSLKNVANELLEHTNKVDFNARNIRYIYRYMITSGNINNGVFSSSLCPEYNGPEWSIDLATLSYYNDMDSIVVLALWLELQYEEFLLFVTQANFIPLARIAQTGVSEYLNTNIISEGIKRNMVCTNHHNLHHTFNKDLAVSINLDALAASNSKEQAGYGGGFNYRSKKEHLASIVAMDAQAYYPELIAGFNLSHETAMLFTVNALQTIIDQYPNLPHNFKIYRFCTHKNLVDETGIDNLDLLDNMSSKQYIFSFQDNGSEVIVDQLSLLSPSERILIISNTPGLLSQLIKYRNHIRNIAKSTKKALDMLIEQSEELISVFEMEQANQDAGIEAEFNMDDLDLDNLEAEEEEDVTLAPFDPTQYKIMKGDLSDEEYMVTPHIKSLEKHHFKHVENKIDGLQQYITILKREFVRINSQYRNMKLINNSIYGLLGSQYGVLKAKNIAAASTMIGRKYIIEAAKVGHSINCRCIYSDTDSVFFKVSNSTVKDPVNHIINTINNHNKHLILNSKIYHDIFVIAKKKYIAIKDEIFSRGINKKGPELWNIKINAFYTKYICEEAPIYMADVFKVMYTLYMDTYKQIRDDPTLVLCEMNIKEESEYKTNTPAKRLITRITSEIPGYEFGDKIVYFNILRNSPSQPFFGLDFELRKTPINEINLYQFYSKISKTLFDILSYSISQTNKKRNVYTKYNATNFKHENLCAFIRANQDI